MSSMYINSPMPTATNLPVNDVPFSGTSTRYSEVFLMSTVNVPKEGRIMGAVLDSPARFIAFLSVHRRVLVLSPVVCFLLLYGFLATLPRAAAEMLQRAINLFSF